MTIIYILFMEHRQCGSCQIELNSLRDGTTEDGYRCHNCYWEQEGGANLIYPDYRIEKQKHEKNVTKKGVNIQIKKNKKLVHLYYRSGRPIYNITYNKKIAFMKESYGGRGYYI